MSDKDTQAFEGALDKAVQLAQSEVTNLASRNSLRWNKGINANRAIELAKQLPKGTFKGSPQKYVRERMVSGLTELGYAGADKMLSANELSITTGAAKAWLDVRGLETPYGPDGALVADIAIDKAYALKSIKQYEEASDTLLTFADNYEESACKNLRKLAKVQGLKGKAVAELIDEIEKLAYSTSVSVSEIIKDRLGEFAEEESMANMRVDKALLEGDWDDLRTHMGAIDQFLGYATEETTGMTTNTRALERVISYFVPRDFGYNAIIQLMIENGEMTQAQAESFMRGLEDDADAEDFADPEDPVTTEAPEYGEDDDDLMPYEEDNEPADAEAIEYGEDPLIEELNEATKDLVLPDTRLQEEIDAEEAEVDDFEFDDDPVYDDDAEDSRPWE